MICDICGDDYAEKHHIFFGKNRNNSEKHDFVVYLCREHHRGTNGVHGKNGHDLDLRLKQQAQKEFETKNTREQFIKIIGKNYL